jgi:hypothetical protein
MKHDRITMKDVVARVTIDRDRYGITSDNEIYLLMTNAAGRERICYHIDDSREYSRIWNQIRHLAATATQN